ncbi:carbohydrate kinase [Cryobacterium adonitolivorans]|uniref:Carbohydrate kinase n=1 Tax=Cryobacterium adonitolivorans TaxID=1259189 RepID=A0A4R8WG76_9MICO|nr:FGGY family carbohydrate kinase [Cryobacterium adonitolivorans]TFC06922.1 carbohydrate kinase [Cryobacterium adonitolivorans]
MTSGSGILGSALWLGVDLGTQSVKVSVVDDVGLVHAAASAPLASTRNGPRHEQDPRAWVGQTRTAMAAALTTLTPADRARIRGVAMCATSGTIATVDVTGSPVSTGLMYDDSRAGNLSDEVAAADPERWQRLGYRIQPTWALPKILWLSRNGYLADGLRVATQADVVAAALTGGPVASDWSHSLKSGYDLIEATWPIRALDTLGIDARHLPDVVAPGTVLGHSCADWSTGTGLPERTPVYAGMTDGCAAQLSAGTLALGDWHTVIGTTMVVKGVSDRIVIDDSGAVYSHRAPHDGLWFPGGASSVGAGAITAMFEGVDLAAGTARIADAYTARPDRIPICYPLVGSGERFPVVRPDAHGFVRAGHAEYSLLEASGHLDGDALLASIFLGVACVERLAVETMSDAGATVTGSFSTSGGGTRNSWWTQLRADLLGRALTVPVSAEGSIGMAILAAWAAGHRKSTADAAAVATLPETAGRMSLVGRVVEPDPTRRAVLDEHYAAFRDTLVTRGWVPSERIVA